MKFSYRVANVNLLQNVNFVLASAKIYLFTGTENTGFHVLGGILAKLFPMPKHTDFPEIKSLLENYTGELNLIEGTLPENTAYVGSDPEQHLLFATVEEELVFQHKNENNAWQELLAIFNLDETFLKREIATLSGGEKMKIALLNAFADKAQTYIFHGIISWLDETGRSLLIKHIIKLKEQGVSVIFLEHEFFPLQEIIDEVYWFDGDSIKKQELKTFFVKANKSLTARNQENIFLKDLSNNKNGVRNILQFSDVDFFDYPHQDTKRRQPILRQISFSLPEHSRYFLIGDNGAGKSTLAKLIFRILQPSEGKIFLLGRPLTSYTRDQLNDLVCYVGQFPSQQLVFNTLAQYHENLREKNNLFAEDLLNEFLPLDEDSSIASLSCLQMKILGLINFSSMKTRLVVLDEPTWGLDLEGRDKFLQVLAAVSSMAHFSLLVISHDVNFINSFEVYNIMKLSHGELIKCV